MGMVRCEWKHNKPVNNDYFGDWMTKCGVTVRETFAYDIQIKGGKFCPFCGKEIKEVHDG